MTPRRNRPERARPIVLPASAGDETETVIERIVPGGFGLGYGGGRTLFVCPRRPRRSAARPHRPRAGPGGARLDCRDPRAGPGSRPGAVSPPLPLRRRFSASPLRRPTRRQERHDRATACAASAASSSPIRSRSRLRRRRGATGPEPSGGTTRRSRRLAIWKPERHRVVDLPDDPFVVPALGERFGQLRERLAAGTPPGVGHRASRRRRRRRHLVRAAAGIAPAAARPRHRRRGAVRVRRRLLFPGQPLRARRLSSPRRSALRPSPERRPPSIPAGDRPLLRRRVSSPFRWHAASSGSSASRAQPRAAEFAQRNAAKPPA